MTFQREAQTFTGAESVTFQGLRVGGAEGTDRGEIKIPILSRKKRETRMGHPGELRRGRRAMERGFSYAD